ncbi:hypothetical protein HELRODRAFT_171664 [Helobdella robusta]|uniref:Uncharacterized protein n=1 Tax=Helobdella robusta TaxID=6412 RepID=T1F4I9_HELRO|nr:hypothetical protein HELRODRAFT_171664 [Helobdella robusta]ESO05298.1 hypothetical protein HELRODRAFT_171664 [Helobdella robusta]
MITGTIGSISGMDLGVIVLYFLVVLGFGFWVGCSLFSTNIGSSHFIGLAGSGALSGLAPAAFEFNAIFVIGLLGWLFVPVYIASGVYTVPEYLQKRFGGNRIRIYLAVLALVVYVFTKISVDLYAGSLFISQAVNWDIFSSILVILVISALFTITGGLTAVMWTDFIQTVIMIIGALYLMAASFIEVGGYQNVMNKFLNATPLMNKTNNGLLDKNHKNGNITSMETNLHDNHTSNVLNNKEACGYPPLNSLHLIRSADDRTLPWPGILGQLILSLWYWCSDQVIVQRTLASKNLSHAKAGCVLAGFLKFLPLWVIVFPGMIARILFPDKVACVDPEVCINICKAKTGCSNMAYPMLVLKLMPNGARGLMLAVMMSALMSSLSSVFNSSSTIFTMDIWKKLRKKATNTELMIAGRIFVLFMVAISTAWIPIVKLFSDLYFYIQRVTSYLAPPICAVYILAMFWAGTTEKGAFFGLMIGLIIGGVRLVVENIYPTILCDSDISYVRPAIIENFHFSYFAIMLFFIVLATVVIISHFTEKVEDKYLIRLLFWNRHSKEPRLDIGNISIERKKTKSTVYTVQDCSSRPTNGFFGLQ